MKGVGGGDRGFGSFGRLAAVGVRWTGESVSVGMVGDESYILRDWLRLRNALDKCLGLLHSASLAGMKGIGFPVRCRSCGITQEQVE